MMKIDQVVVLVYLLFGIVLGVASNYFNKTLGSLLLAFVAPVGLYLVTVFPLIHLVKQKQRKWLIQNSIITFFLIWLIVWIILHNM
ncbi:MAG TPA: hypothetical protein VJJ76_00090 [archaeon]|nr:hypothetical protein [archaeon]